MRVKGVRKRKKVGPNKKLAEQALMDVQVKLANKAPSAYKRRDCLSVAHLTKAFGSCLLYEITPQMIEKDKATRLQTVIKKTGRTLTPTTVNREMRVSP